MAEAENTQLENTSGQEQKPVQVSVKGDKEKGCVRMFVNGEPLLEVNVVAAAKVAVGLTPTKIDDAVFATLEPAIKSTLGALSVTV